MQTGYCFAGLRIAAPIPKSFFEEIGSESIEQDFTFKLGKVTIPVSEIWNSLLKIISVLPVFFRNRYKNSLIQVCLTGNDNKTRLTVHRRRGYEEKKGSSVYRPIGSKKPDLWRTISYSKVYDTENLHKLNDLVRDAAFMILDVNDYEEDKGDSDLSHSNWRSMRCLVDGFDDFENYKNTGKKDYMDDARNNFKKSIEENPEGGYTAMFYYSVQKEA